MVFHTLETSCLQEETSKPRASGLSLRLPDFIYREPQEPPPPNPLRVSALRSIAASHARAGPVLTQVHTGAQCTSKLTRLPPR